MNIYYLLATFGFDTAENEPEYGYGISLIFVSFIFGPVIGFREDTPMTSEQRANLMAVCHLPLRFRVFRA